MKTYFTGILMVSTLLAFSQNLEKKIFTTLKTSKSLLIDGDLNDEAWLAGEWAGDFTQHEPHDGAKPSQKTEFKVLYDDAFIYVAIKAYDTRPDSIEYRMTRRDDSDGDLVGISFDSYHDLRTAFTFIVSAAGVKSDMLLSNDGSQEDASWDPIWQVKTQKYLWGWAAEMKIPFTQLRFEKNSSDVWGVEVLRRLFRNDEMNFWQHIPRNSSGIVHMFGELAGLEAIQPKKIMDLTPYTVTSFEHYEKQEGNPFLDGRDFGASFGLDGKMGITNNITLDFTINPDFGQVEADPSQVNLTAYEAYFEERRPFFVEGKNITSLNLGLGDGDIGNDNLFYSRRIGKQPSGSVSLENGEYYKSPRNVRILGAAKITGKTKNGLSVGFLETITPRTYATIDSAGVLTKQQIEPFTNYFVGRVQKDINEGNTVIGGMVTHTYRDLSSIDNIEDTNLNYLHKSALTGGIDFTQFFKDKNYALIVSTAFSDVQGSKEAIEATQLSARHFFQRSDANHVTFDPNRTSLSGTGGKMELGKFGGNWNFMLFSSFKSPGFEINDLGFTQASDQVIYGFWTGYKFITPKAFYRSIRVNLNGWGGSDFALNAAGNGGNININTQFKNYWNGSIGVNTNTSAESTTLLRGGPNMILPGRTGFFAFVGTDNRKKLSFNVNTNINRGGEGYLKNMSVSGTVNYRPLQNLQISFEPSRYTSINQLQYVSERQNEGGKSSFIMSEIDQEVWSFSLRFNYSITPDMTIQYWGQPFFAKADYSNFKVIDQPKATAYADRFHVFNAQEIQLINGTYEVDENNNGNVDYTFQNPDFTFDEFLSNLVFRWEFIPGSSVYLVWSQSRNAYLPNAGTELASNFDDLFSNTKPTNVFLMKFSYRIGLH